MASHRIEDREQQRLAEELSIAHRIQLSLLPDFCPVVSGWRLCTTYRAVREVSGDFYDFLEFDNASEHLGLVIADVADKGVPAALFGAMSRTTIRATALGGYSPADALRRANDLIVQTNRADVFLTAVYALLDVHTGTMVYANAGHNRPLWYQDSTRKCRELVSTGMAMALFEDIKLEEYTVDLGPGDKVVFYTDGVTEAMNADLEEFGSARLHAVMKAHPNDTASTLVSAIEKAVIAFCGDVPQSDDFTLFVIERSATSEAPAAETNRSGCL